MRNKLGDMPQCFLVNRFAMNEAAQAVYDRTHKLISGTGAQDLSVHTMIVDGLPYVIVVGKRPKQSIWHQLVDIFAIGQPADLPDDMLKWLNCQR